jgi:hypothetical protein
MSNKEMEDFKKAVTDTLKSYLNIILVLFTLLGGVIGWHTLEIIKLDKDATDVKTDIGVILITAPPDHQASRMYEELYRKYFPNSKGS